MQRQEMLTALETGAKVWDVIIIGGGATGLGIAIEAVTRGLRTLLLEQGDFGQGTSSRSTKLIHGGVRYLRQGNVSLVLEALKERGRLHQNAPHLVGRLAFVIPIYHWWEFPLYGIGLQLYDRLAGKNNLGRSSLLSRQSTLAQLPNIQPRGLLGGVKYFDGQFEDARLIINLAETAAEQGAYVLNYVKVAAFLSENQRVAGVVARDVDSGREYELRAKVVINATGVFADAIRRLEKPDLPVMITPSQGVHLVLERRFLPGNTALMVPRTDDGRVLFLIPWLNHVLVGTTDTAVPEITLEPLPLAHEIEYLLTHAARYLTEPPTAADIRSVFVGLRPLVNLQAQTNTKSISREHFLLVSPQGVITITGGKWTTYRKMAQDTLDLATRTAQFTPKNSRTTNLKIHAFHTAAEQFGEFHLYGADAPQVQALLAQHPTYQNQIHPALSPRLGEIIWAVRNEMALTVADFLARRTRCLLLDARSSIEAAPRVAEVMARELGKDRQWQIQQVQAFTELARRYLWLEN
ncbi:glycerol-3-phosphate dehydrogenase/oxidase [candidate division KSB1 bacterium]|nr:glycerol-3-phosphate dehydrogenase/oxidase [candidate division KSB1 bacterium]